MGRKQANRRSGMFEDKKPEPPSPEGKPSLPTKPSENRKSLGSFGLRNNSLGEKGQPNRTDVHEKNTRGHLPSLNKAASASLLPDHPTNTAATVSAATTSPQQSTAADKRRDKSPRVSNDAPSSKSSSNNSQSADGLNTVSADLAAATTVTTTSTTGSRKSINSLSNTPNNSTTTSNKDASKPTPPSVHSANLGRPEARSLASLPERPSDIAGLAAKAAASGNSRRSSSNSSSTIATAVTTTNNNFVRPMPGGVGGSEKSSLDLNDSVFYSLNNTSIKQDISEINHSTTAAASGSGDRIPDKVSTYSHTDNQIEELRSKLAAVQTEFAGQISELKSLLALERQRRMDLETEVEGLRRLVMKRKE